jgi:2-polyprenyl-3-methyl-5-hydroxy-6-metoxy-1,4-benzoquinol methylase
MTLLTALGLAAKIQGTRVGRSWPRRIKDLEACGIDYSGKTVLDAGCNVGILAYEIAERGPAFIHLIDDSREMLDAAKLIFRSVDTPHRLDLADLANDRRLRKVLRPSYGIVQLLAVYQHVERARGDRAARQMLATLAEHCSETFVAASNPAFLPAITETLTASGLRLERETISPHRRVKHLVFRR